MEKPSLSVAEGTVTIGFSAKICSIYLLGYAGVQPKAKNSCL